MKPRTDRILAASIVAIALASFWLWPWLWSPPKRPATRWVPAKSTACLPPRGVTYWLETWEGGTA